MREELLHCLWKYKKIGVAGLKTTGGETLIVSETGSHNQLAGPDFFNARVTIGDQLWAGNVEIHINSSDWYNHRHEEDENYDNVILHVVWNHDSEVYRKDNSVIPVLELKEMLSPKMLENYRELFEKRVGTWINCEKDLFRVENFEMDFWLERIYFERLEEKAHRVREMLKNSANDWEEVFFRMLAKNFGLNVNGEAFLAMANSFPFSVVRKVQGEPLKLEALFFGQAGMLEADIEDGYYLELKKEYIFLKSKYKLQPSLSPSRFFRLRPDNFPNIRLAQLARLYADHKSLFSEIIGASGKEELREIFNVRLNDFWESHYTFEKGHNPRKKNLSLKFTDLLIINTVVPVKFCFAGQQGTDINEELLDLMNSLEAEANKIIEKFEELRPDTAGNAMQSQALLELKKNYCDLNRCLECSLGLKLLERK